MAAVDHVYTWDEIASTRVYVTSGDAHKVLADFRQEASGERGADGTVAVNKPALDLTWDRRFNWWGYLAGHPEGQQGSLAVL